jgi:hypothetical protein
MEPHIIFIGASIVFVAIIVFVSVYFSKKATIKRKLKNAISKKITDFTSGQFAKVVGNVEFVDEPLKAPLSGRPCACYYLLIEQHVSTGKSSHWKKILEDEKSVKFVVRDGRSVAYVNDYPIKRYIVQDQKYRSGFMNDATPQLKSLLRQYGLTDETWLGFNKSLRYTEGILEKNEVIAALGIGTWKNAAQLSLPESYGRVLEISAPENDFIYLSDDPDTVKNLHADKTF